MQLNGFDAEGIDISPEQAALDRAAGVARVRQGDFRAILASHPAHYTSITATDPEVLETFTQQLAAAAAFDSALTRSSPPVARALASTVRAPVWHVVSACCRIALTAATEMLRGHVVIQNPSFATRKSIGFVSRADEDPA